MFQISLIHSTIQTTYSLNDIFIQLYYTTFVLYGVTIGFYFFIGKFATNSLAFKGFYYTKAFKFFRTFFSADIQLFTTT